MSASYPLASIGVSINHFKCFGDKSAGFEAFQPINIIIGRNNSGKSALIDVIELCISKGAFYDNLKHARGTTPYEVTITQMLDEKSLRRVFPEQSSGGGIPGPNQWMYGKAFVGQLVGRRFSIGWKPSITSGLKFDEIMSDRKQGYIEQLAEHMLWPFENIQLLRVSAERDVQPEARTPNRDINPNGIGTTNLIRAFINSDDLPRKEVEQGLLNDLNEIYLGDSQFNEIICQEDKNDMWEIYLGEENKEDVRLSQSGSSLKSIFIICSLLRLKSIIQNTSWNQTVLSIEEPENNLHPALLRRLLNFLAKVRETKGFTLIVTTHSPIGIDWSSRRSDSQIIHVKHDGQAASSQAAIGYLRGRDILDDLDVRASDILQANGVIWVEGPSDRIYIKRWLDLTSKGELKETVHYAIMFYGGRLLSHIDVLPPDERDALISVLSINRNAAVLIDSDRREKKSNGRKPSMRLNSTKQRIKRELEKISGFVWITEGKEIENYTPIKVYARVAGKPAPSANHFTQIVDLPLLKEFKKDKVAIAHAVAPATEKPDLVGHLDIEIRLKELCSHIRRWNGIES